MTDEIRPSEPITRRQLLQQVGSSAIILALQPDRALSDDARSSNNTAQRIRESFDFGWRFFKGDAPGAEQPDFSEAGWRDVDLPHDWSIEGPFDQKAPSGGTGGYLPTGIGWYRKRFFLPESLKGSLITIEFDGVYENSEVWVNGQYVGKRPYGYVPFAYDVTAHLNFGSHNIVSVKVDNSHQTNCRWYSGSGIYRHTWLLATNPIHVGYWGAFAWSTRVTKASATVNVRTVVKNDGNRIARCTLATSIVDKDGNQVQTSQATSEIAANGEHEFTRQLEIVKPNLWSTDSPYLYTVRTTLLDENRIVDEYTTRIGIRDVAFDPDKGFLLNGEPVKLNGVCVHHDGGCVGAAVPTRVWERRLELLREMGCNAIRTSHNPFAAEFLDLCDRMGFFVMNEVFDEWKQPKGQIGPNGYSKYFDEWYERDVRNFIHRDRNHPSVILWSAGNEVGDQSDSKGAETLRKLLDVFHTEDPTRLVTVGCDRIESEPPSNTVRPEFLALLDVVGYNYADRWRDRREKYYGIDRERFPRRLVIGTESSAMSGVRGDYGYLFGGGTGRGFGGSARGRQIDVEQLWKFVRLHDYVAGDFMWTGIDHIGESFWPGKGSSAGVLDTCGFKKDGFYFYQSQWTDKPMLHLFPHWNWKGREGQFIPVTCYTNCDTVELFINGRSVGVKGYAFPRTGMEGRYGNYPARARVPRTTADLHLSWDVPYERGTLKAVGTKNGEVVVAEEVSTTREPYAIDLSADRNAIAADGRDVAHMTVRILDDRGRVVPTAANEIAFLIKGDGNLIGADNGDPQSHEDYKSDRRKAFNGMCLAIVQSTGRQGNIEVTATSPGLEAGKVMIATITPQEKLAGIRRP